MKKVTVNKFLCILIVTIICSTFFSVNIWAASVFFVTDSQLLYKAEDAALDAIDMSSGSLFETYDASGQGGGGFYLNKEFYDSLTNKQKKLCMREFVAYLKKSPMSNADKQVIYNSLKEIDDRFITSEISALLNDSKSGMFRALTIMKPFQGTFGIIMGVTAIILMFGVVFITVVDLFFLGIPVFAVKDDGKKPKLMSPDAFKALKETQETGGNVYILYFKRRAITFVLLILCIVYLVTGSLGDLFASLVDLFGGITDVFGG